MMLRRRLLLSLLPVSAGLMLCGVPRASHADTLNEAVVGGTLVHTVRTTWAGLSPDQRAAIVQERVNGALSMGPIYSGDFTVGMVQGDWCVLFRGKRFITADAATAKQENSSAKALATQWLAYVQQTLPPLTKPMGK